MNPRNNLHMSLFSFSRSPPILFPPPLVPPRPAKLFPPSHLINPFSLSFSDSRGYLNLLTAGLYPRAIDYRFAHADDTPPSSFSPLAGRRQLYKPARERVYSLFLPLSLIPSPPWSLPSRVLVLHFYYIFLWPREMSLLFFFLPEK